MSEANPGGHEEPHMKFGMATAVFVVMASMIGGGVLTTSGYTVYEVGSNQYMMILWVIGGVVAVCGALTLAELATALPRSGGDYVFLSEAYGPLVGFLSGWVSFWIGFGAPIAASAVAAAKYLTAPLALEGATATVSERAIATAIILFFSAVHATSRRGTVRVQAAVTVVKLGLLCALAAVGLAASWGRWENLDDAAPMTGGTLTSALFSMVFIAYAYTGWNGAGYLAGEVDRPQQRLPVAILGGTVAVLVLYLALNLFYALALPSSEVRAIADLGGPKENIDGVAEIARLAAMKVLGQDAGNAISVAIGLTLLASLSAFILTGPRVTAAMARAGQFPAIAGRLRPGTGTPDVATWLQAAWAVAVLWTGTFQAIMVFASVGLSMFSILTIASVYVLRARRPDLPRPFRTPGYPVVPMVYLVPTTMLTVAAFVRSPKEAGLSLACIVAGVPFYLGRGSLAGASARVRGWWRSGRISATTPSPSPSSTAENPADILEEGSR